MGSPFSIFPIPAPHLRPAALFSQPVPRIAQRAVLQRQTAATNAIAQLIAQLRQPLDARIQVGAPELGQSPPIRRRRCAVRWQHTQRLLDFRQRNAGALGDFDHRDAPQNAARVAPLIAGGAPAADQAAALVKMQGRHRYATTARHLADGHFPARCFVCVIHHPTP